MVNIFNRSMSLYEGGKEKPFVLNGTFLCNTFKHLYSIILCYKIEENWHVFMALLIVTGFYFKALLLNSWIQITVYFLGREYHDSVI